MTCMDAPTRSRSSRRRALRRVCVALAATLAVVAATACSSPPDRSGPDPATTTAPLPVGDSSHTLEFGGRSRTYLVHRPDRLPDPAPLVVMLHGGFGSAQQAEDGYGWDAEADAGHFLVVYPDGLGRAWNTGGGCCGQSGRDGVDDVGFIAAVVQQVGRLVPVDAARTYATGMSNGAIMTYTLACRTSLFAAIGPVAGTRLDPCRDPEPVSVLHLHGTADDHVRYDGGRGSGVAHIDGPAVPEVVAGWRSVDQCETPRTTTDGPVTTSVADCRDGRTVELVTVAGAGHQWPGSSSKPLVEKALGTDPPSDALDATSMLWDFFRTHPAP